MSDLADHAIPPNLSLLTPQWPAPANVRACITLAEPDNTAYGRTNLALHVGDDEQKVVCNRALLAQQLGVSRWQWLQQVHSAKVVTADGRAGLHEAPRADGCSTREPDLACAVLTADCLPVLLCNQQGTQVAAVHAGWRGLAAGILASACQQFNSDDKLVAYLGPAIGPSAFEVGSEVKEAFENAMGHDAGWHFSANPLRAQHYFADLYALARLHLGQLGVTQVAGGDFCTFRDARFYSYRREAVTGRFASVIWRI
ncbi:MAG TPA: peptidoglycan editing factor PgeF [Marinagarivorans sp.]